MTYTPPAPTLASMIALLQGQVGGLPLERMVASDVAHAQSNTALSDITGLTFDIGASATEVWEGHIALLLSAANATVDVKVGWNTLPAGAACTWGARGGGGAALPSFGAAPQATSNPTALAAGTATIDQGSAIGTFGEEFGFFVYGGGTPGTLQLRFAQFVSNATDLKVLKGSSLRVWKKAS